MSWQRKLRVLPLAQLCLALLVASTLGCAELRIEDFTRILNATGGLDEATVSDGLRQALTVGTERASGQLSASGGFGQNPTLRLVLPDQLDPMVTTARTLGFGSTIDSLETGMNRAAEAAAGEAVPVFANAIAAMSIQDAFRILRGPDDAATEYFRAQTSEPLRARFAPVVRGSMERVGLYAQYKSLVDRYAAIPFAKPMPPSLEDYVTDRTLSGLFGVLAEEEARIREDPAARTTQLLRKVFASSSATGAAAP